jgi:hypothetical protein
MININNIGMNPFRLRYVCQICDHVLVEMDQSLEQFNAKIDVVCPNCHTQLLVQRIVSSTSLLPRMDKKRTQLDNPEKYI